MTHLPRVGVAARADDLPALRPWLETAPRLMELQDFANGDLLTGNWQAHADRLAGALRGLATRIGIHGPYTGLSLIGGDQELRTLIERRYLRAVDVAQRLVPTIWFCTPHFASGIADNLDLTKDGRKPRGDAVAGLIDADPGVLPGPGPGGARGPGLVRVGAAVRVVDGERRVVALEGRRRLDRGGVEHPLPGRRALVERHRPGGRVEDRDARVAGRLDRPVHGRHHLLEALLGAAAPVAVPHVAEEERRLVGGERYRLGLHPPRSPPPFPRTLRLSSMTG